jgi:hypothetical protein
MKLDPWTYLSLYYEGRLGPGVALAINLLFIYLLSFLLTVCVGLLFYLKYIRPFGLMSLFFLCLVPTALVLPLLARGFLSDDYHFFEASLLTVVIVPAAWVLPIMALYYGKKLIGNSNEINATHKIGYSIILFVEGLALLTYVPWLL